MKAYCNEGELKLEKYDSDMYWIDLKKCKADWNGTFTVELILESTDDFWGHKHCRYIVCNLVPYGVFGRADCIQCKYYIICKYSFKVKT